MRHRRFAAWQRGVAVAVLVASSLLAGASGAAADRFGHSPVTRQRVADWGRPPAQAAPIRYADAGGAWRCGGVLWVAFTSKDIIRNEITVVHDDSHVTVQMLVRNGRAHAPDDDGGWMSVGAFGLGPVQPAREGYYRWPELRDAESTQGGAVVDKARVVRAGIASTPVAIQEGCPG